MLTVEQGIAASLYNLLTQVTRRVIGIFSLMILARLLTPEDFGLVAIALIFLNFVDVISQSGGRQYLLSRNNLEDYQVHTNWTMNFILKNSLALLLAISSLFVADFYQDDRLVPIILVLSLQVFVLSMQSPGIIYKYKNQDLKAIMQWNLVSRLVTTGITISIAVFYKSYWALIIGQFMVASSTVIMSYVLAPKVPVFSLSNFKPQWSFSKWILPQSLVNFGKTQFDTIYVSTIFDKAVMGAYNSIRYYGNIPATMLVKPAFGTFLAQASQFKNTPSYFEKQLQVVFYLIGIICFPIISLIYQQYDFLVLLILGQQWIGYAELLGVFSFFTIVVALNHVVANIAMLKDKTFMLLLYSIFAMIVQIVVLVAVDFEDVFELAKYKIAIDIFSVFIFFVLVVYLLVSKIAVLILSSVMSISVIFVLVSGFIAQQVSFYNVWVNFILQCTITLFIFGLLHLVTILLFKDKVHCFAYIHNLMLKLLKLSKDT